MIQLFIWLLAICLLVELVTQVLAPIMVTKALQPSLILNQLLISQICWTYLSVILLTLNLKLK